MPPRRALLDDDEDIPMALPSGTTVPVEPIALDFGAVAPPESLFQQLVRHWLNERHAPDILPTQAEILSALLDHIRRQVRAIPPPRRLTDTFLCELHYGRRTRYRRCVGTLTRQRRSTRGSCSSRPKSSASSLSCAPTSARGSTRCGAHFSPVALPLVTKQGTLVNIDRKICATHRGHAGSPRAIVPGRAGSCETARVPPPCGWRRVGTDLILITGSRN